MKFTWLLGLSVASAAMLAVAADTPAKAPPATATGPATAPRLVARGPHLVIKDADPKAQEAIRLEKADIVVSIAGPLAETTTILTFHNTTNRVLEGELEFPLPENAAVSGYGLDVNGVLVDGVPVAKQRARQIFESEVRKGVDPGILEQTRGNNFKTRIYPLPADGRRTVKITYVSDLSLTANAATYSLPLEWNQKIGDARIRVELEPTKGSSDPLIAGLGTMSFELAEGRLVATKALHNVELAGALSVTVPAHGRMVAVENRQKPASFEELSLGKKIADAARPESYFVIASPPSKVALKRDVKRPSNVCILWDASLSREKADKKDEIELVKQLAGHVQNGTIDIVRFSNTADRGVSFTVDNGKADEIVKFLEKITYDGATSFDAVKFPKNPLDASTRVTKEIPPDYDFTVLFSDGIATLGAELPARSPVPVFTVAGDARADHVVLKAIAENSGGGYLNLQRMTPEEALKAFAGDTYGLVSVTYDEKQIAEVYPRGPQAVTSRQYVSGRLLAPEATITLNYGVGTTVMSSEKITLKTADATATALVSRFWAQQKINALSAMAERNADELLALGREFNLVTPNSSLMVLERVEQYLEHRVVPPRSHPELYKAFSSRIEEMGRQRAGAEEAKINRVLAMWQERVRWWEVKRDVPATFRVAGANTKKAVTEAVPSADTTGAPVATGTPATPAAAPATAARVEDVRRLSERQAALGVHPEATAATARPSAAEGQKDGAASVAGAGTFGIGPAGGAAGAPAPVAPRPGVGVDASSGNVAGQTRDRAQAGAGHGGGGASGGGLFGGGGETGRAGDIAHLRATQADRAPAARAGEDAKAYGDNLSFGARSSVTVKEWDPKTPYLAALRAAAPGKAYDTYLAQRNDFGQSPAFYLECADFFFKNDARDTGVRILSNVAELKLESAPLLRVAGYRYEQLSYVDLAIDLFEKARRLRPDEPQSDRDLARALAVRGLARLDDARHVSDLNRAMELYANVVMNKWERFDQIEVIALMEANALWAQMQRLPSNEQVFTNPLDPRLTKNLDCDLRIVMTWDADNTDIDLHLFEPSGEECYYGNNRSQIGGLVSRDFTDGYGPEEYVIRKAQPGAYKIKAHYFGSRQQTIAGPVTVQATVITNFGRPAESRQALTLRLDKANGTVDIGEALMK